MCSLYFTRNPAWDWLLYRYPRIKIFKKPLAAHWNNHLIFVLDFFLARKSLETATEKDKRKKAEKRIQKIIPVRHR